MTPKNREEWQEAMARYMAGQWQAEVPPVAGRYLTATAYGEPGDIIFVYIHPDTGVPTPTRNWGGFWWSDPLPDLPPVPQELLDAWAR